MNVTELEQCIEMYGTGIYAFCRQVTYSQSDAEELYQDTFLRAMEKIEMIQMSGNVKSYLLSIAIRLAKNKKRKYAWRNRIASMETLTEEKQEHWGEAMISPEEAVLQKEETARVREKVRGLDERYRLPVYLYYMESLSVEEISYILKIPRGTVKSRLYKAREILRNQLTL